MTITVIVIGVIVAVLGRWLYMQRLATKPWLEQGPIGDVPSDGPIAMATPKLGLFVFLAAITSLFSLFISAYAMRMELSDWTPLPTPSLLWFNTAVLFMSSAGMQWAQSGANRGRLEDVRRGLLVGGGFALAFLAGQLIVWQELVDLGYFLKTNPAASFFYLLTGLHGLHLIGGLIAWGKTTAKAWSGAKVSDVAVAVELCTVYWHFLLLIWLVLFGLLLTT